jgi:L-histidine Nalpha-methyltransferase
MRRSAALETPHPAPADRFAADARRSLSLTPRQLPSRYLYDELGSALFEAITRLPWYGIARREQRLLRAHGREILARVAPLATLIELGPGRGEKLATLVSGAVHRAVTVHLIDVSAAALDVATSTLAQHPALEVVTHATEYQDGLAEIAHAARAPGRTLALFLGSNIGNFDPPEADALLRGIRAALTDGDALLLGTDLVKPERELVLAYDDPLGVTAAFDRNLLVRANRELGADFDLDAFAHRALWNERASRVEMHLVSERRQRVRIPASCLAIDFEAGESIRTESSYKYLAGDVRAMLERAGFRAGDQWQERSFALTLAHAA